MQHNLILNALICSTLLISGCSLLFDEPTIQTAPIEKPPLVIQKPEPINLQNVKWTILTRDNYITVMDRFSESGINPALFAVTDEGYETLALNLVEIRRYIEQQNAVIAAYEGYYLDINSAIDEYNSDLESQSK